MVKEIARDRIGIIPISKVVPHKNKKAAKYPKKQLEDEMNG